MNPELMNWIMSMIQQNQAQQQMPQTSGRGLLQKMGPVGLQSGYSSGGGKGKFSVNANMNLNPTTLQKWFGQTPIPKSNDEDFMMSDPGPYFAKGSLPSISPYVFNQDKYKSQQMY